MLGGLIIQDQVVTGTSIDETLLDMLNYLINNIYFTFGNTVFRQTIGIPMGTYSAPFLAHFFLYCYEFKWGKFELVLLQH